MEQHSQEGGSGGRAGHQGGFTRPPPPPFPEKLADPTPFEHPMHIEPRGWLLNVKNLLKARDRFHGVVVSTLDFESSDPSSNPGGTLFLIIYNNCYESPGMCYPL